MSNQAAGSKCQFKGCGHEPRPPPETMRAHIAQAHLNQGGALFVCPDCGKRYKTGSSLQRHIVEHNDPHRYKCLYSQRHGLDASGQAIPLCADPGFSRVDSLASHLLSHHAKDLEYCVSFTHCVHGKPLVAQDQNFDQQQLLASPYYDAFQAQLMQNHEQFVAYDQELSRYREQFGLLGQEQQVDQQQ